jgi:hypothetical protein
MRSKKVYFIISPTGSLSLLPFASPVVFIVELQIPAQELSLSSVFKFSSDMTNGSGETPGMASVT